jgi:hypothetical protein
MRNKVAKKYRKEAGKQSSDSNRLYYESLKREHNKKEVTPNFKESRRALRGLTQRFVTKTTVK